jgi:hypothetical protein
MKKLFTVFCLILAGLVGLTEVNAQTTLAGWEMNGLSAYGASPLAATTTASNVTIGGLTRGTGFTTAGTAAGNGWGGTGLNEASFANAVAGNDFASFQITANAGFTVSLTQIAAYNIRRSSSGPTTGKWQYQVGSGSFVDIGTEITWGGTTSSTGNSQAAIDLSGIGALQNVAAGTTVTIRCVLWGASLATGTWYLNNFQTGNDIVITGSVTSTSNPNANLSSPNQIAASNVNQGATNHIFSAFQAAVTDDDATLTALSFISAGSYTAAADLSNYILWYNTADIFGAATNIGSVASGVASGNTVTFSSLNQSIAENATGYFWITADVAPGATASNTISFTTHNLTFGSGNQSGSIADGGAQTIQSVTPLLALSSPNPAVAAGNINQNSTNNIIYRFDLATSVANTALTAVDITTTGDYAANGVSNLKIWYSNDATFDAGTDDILATIATPTTAGVQSFSGFNQLLTSGSTEYIFITVDITCAALANAIIGVAAITTADITTTASESGTANAGGTQTIQEVTPNNATALAASVANTETTVSWTNPTSCFNEVLVVVKAGSSISGTPTGDGAAYTADLDFAGAGTSFDGGKVVYKGTTSGQTVTGLTNGTQYFVKIYSRNGESWSAGVEVDVTPANIVTINFDDAAKWSATTPSSYGNHTYTDGSVTFQGTNVLRDGTSTQDGFASALGVFSYRLRNASGSQLVATVSSGGVGNFSFDIRRWDNDPNPAYTIRYSTNGGSSYTTTATINNTSLNNSSNWTTFNGTINSPFNNIIIEIIKNDATGERIMVDNFVYSPKDYETTTWNGSTWSNSTPDATKNVTISGNLANTTAFTANNLTINNGISLSFAADEDLTVNGDLVNDGTLDIAANTLTLAGNYSGTGSIRGNGGDIVLNGTGDAGSLSFDQTTDGTTNTVANFTLNRTSAGEVSLANKLNITNQLVLTNGVLNTAGFVHLKSTSATATATVVGGTNASINGNVTAERFLPWTSAGNNGFRFVSHPLASNPVINTVSNLPTANNTLVGYNEGANAYEGINNRAATWPQGIGYGAWTNAANTLSFTGALQLSDVSAVSMGNAVNRWNFAGNPFPSTIDWEALTTTDMQDAVWVWVKNDITEGGGDWASYVEGVSANGGSRYIAPMQGFMVRALNTGTPSIAYPAAARVSNQAPSFQRTQIIGDVYRVKATKAANNSAMETVIRFRAMATPNHDAAYDAEFMSDFANATPDLYTTDANGVKYSINALPEMGSAAVLVPLQLETFGAGDFSFTFDASQLVSGVSVQLEDTKLGTFTHLVDGQVVNFSAAASDAVNRFRLHFNGLATSVAANNLDLIQMYAYEGALYIRGAERAESLRILDISGRTVFSAQQLELDGNAIRPNLAKGTYLVQLVNETGVKTVKVIF